MEKAIAYCRVSTDDQENSLSLQKQKIESYCQLKNLHLIDTISDEDVSGFKELNKRPGGQKLLSLIPIHQIKHVIVIKHDRLFRNTIDALLTIDEWNKRGISLHLVDVGGNTISTTTAIGRLMFTTIVSFGEFERNIGAERTKAVLNNKKSQMNVYGSIPLGFNNSQGSLTPNPEEMLCIKQIFLLKSHGKGPDAIASSLNLSGCKTKTGKKFLPTTIRSILNNSIYTPYI